MVRRRGVIETLADDGKRCCQPLDVACIHFRRGDVVELWGRGFGRGGLVASDVRR